MNKNTIQFVLYRVILPLPILATLFHSLKSYGQITVSGLFFTHITSPQVWVLDAIFISSFLLGYIYIKNMEGEQEQNSSYSSSFKIYRYIGLIWGILTYATATFTVIYHDHQVVTSQLFVDYQVSHPLLIGLLFCIPFFYSLGYLIEKMFVTKEENRLKSLEIEKQNEQLQKEIHDRKLREAELIEAKKEAMMGAKAKDQFLSNMSHEIRTPMNGVMGLASLLKDTELNEEQLEYATSIEMSAKNLLVLINQILDLSKINSEKLDLEYIDFDIRKNIKAVENTFKSTANEKGIILRTIIDSQVPDVICGDPVRFNQILLNLIGNAVKFTKEGGVDLIINATSTDDGPRLSVQVNDTGIGIPKDKLSAIFESFSQASSETTRMYGGTGLGLAISRELVELYGGRLKVESELGKGSCFSFELQLRSRQGKDEVLTEDTKPPQLKKDFDPKKVKILLAEDNLVNQLVAKATLRKHGFELTVAPNGQEVIEYIYKEHFDLILMDVQMPVMSGLDATRFIRNATESPLSEIKIIAMTASAMKEDIDRCLAVGMDDYITKPFKAEDLFDKLYEHLELKD